jgi:hypothetical protein
MPVDQISDVADNTNSEAVTTQFSVDTTPPSVQSFTAVTPSLTRGPSVSITVTMSEPVNSTFTASQAITLAGQAQAPEMTVVDETVTFTLFPGAQGTNSPLLNAQRFNDAAGNLGPTSNVNLGSFVFDSLVGIQSVTGAPANGLTNAASLSLTLNFDELVTVDVARIQCTRSMPSATQPGGAVSSLSVTLTRPVNAATDETADVCTLAEVASLTRRATPTPRRSPSVPWCGTRRAPRPRSRLRSR